MIDDLIREAVEKFGFRSRFANEPDGVYRDKLIKFVAKRDYAAAHELRVGRRQADWTSEDTANFRQRMSTPRDPKLHDPTVPFACIALKDPGPYPVTDDQLLLFAQDALQFCRRFRTENPLKDFHIMASVLLTNGAVHHTMPDRGDRIRVLKHLVRTEPVYGFWLAADVFVHALSTDEKTGVETATKQDAFIVHVGSRSLRRVFQLRYRVAEGYVVFEPGHELPIEGMSDDPYADIFVSVPESNGRPS